MSAVVTLTMNPAVDISASVEQVRPADKLRCSPAALCPGGGGINVARVVQRLGGDVTAIYTTGGATGRLLESLTRREHVPSLTIEVMEATRQNFTILEEASGEEYRFVFPGAALEEAEWQRCLQAARELPFPPRYIVASGSLPPEVPDDFYARLARLARGFDARLVLDTSGPALADALVEGVYLMKPNLRELSQLLGGKFLSRKQQLAAARGLVAKGRAQAVALTRGAAGALLVTADIALEASAPNVQQVSSVGAGDSFLGAMVHELAAGRDFEEAFRTAVAAGTAALLTSGTELCRPGDVDRLREQVVIGAL